MPTAEFNPHYLDLADRFRREIYEKHFRPGDRFHSIRKLIASTGRSLPTVRRALDILIEEGMLESRHGSGIYVTQKVGIPAGDGPRRLVIVLQEFARVEEPWFMGRLAVGMLGAAQEKGTVVSFYQKSKRDSERPEEFVAHILAQNPSGAAILHATSTREEDALIEALARRGIPVATSMRPHGGATLIREDDTAFGTLVAAQFFAAGHREIGAVLGESPDDYYDSKWTALQRAAELLGLRCAAPNRLVLKPELRANPDEAYRRYLSANPGMTGIVALDSVATPALIASIYTDPAGTPTTPRVAILHNVLEGDPIPTLPGGGTVATISPPLEKIGEAFVDLLLARVERRDTAAAANLMPIYTPGQSMIRGPAPA